MQTYDVNEELWDFVVDKVYRKFQEDNSLKIDGVGIDDIHKHMAFTVVDVVAGACHELGYRLEVKAGKSVGGSNE